MILGRWVNKEDKNLSIHISPNKIVYFYKNKMDYFTNIVLRNDLKNCNEKISNYPPSKIRIVEWNNKVDSTIIHIISIDLNQMEWAVENNNVHWKKIN